MTATSRPSAPKIGGSRSASNVVVLVVTVGVAVAVGLLVGRVPTPLAVAAVGAAGFAGAAVFRPELLIPLASGVLLFPGRSVPVVASSTSAIVFALTAVWLSGVLLRRWRLHRGHLIVLGLALWLVIGYAAHDHPNTGLSAASDLYTLLCGLLLCAVAMSVPVATVWFLRSVAAGSLILSIIIIRTPKVLTGALGTSERAEALGLNSNYLGQELVLCLIACLALAFLWRERWALVPAVVTTVALLGTESRGALVALFLTGGLLLWTRTSTTIRIAIVSLAALFIAFGPSVGQASSALLSRDSREYDLHNEARADAAVTAARYLVTNPVLGIGYGEFSNVAADDPTFGVFVATHNDWLRFGAETGVVGLILLGALLLPCTWLRGHDRTTLTMRAILICGCIGLLFGNFLSSTQVSSVMWIALGLLWAERERRRTAATTAAETDDRMDERSGARSRG